MSNVSYTSYAGLKSARSADNSMLTANPLELQDSSPVLSLDAFADGRLMRATINKTNSDGSPTAEYADFLVTLAPYVNQPISKTENRFETHDWSDIQTWNGRTHGSQAAWLPNSVNFRPVVVGLQMTVGWTDANGNLVSYLDQTLADSMGRRCCWKNAAGTIICRYDVDADGWLDNNGNDHTDSSYVIAPPQGMKLLLGSAKLQVTTGAIVQPGSPIHYTMFSYYPPLGAVVPVIDWVYPDVATFEAGANTVDHGSPLTTMVIDYTNSGSVIPVLDSLAAQRLVISSQLHKKVMNASVARGTFYAVFTPSF